MQSQQKELYEDGTSFHKKMELISNLAKTNRNFEVSSPYIGPYANEFKSWSLINEDGTLTPLGYDMADTYKTIQANYITFVATKSTDNLIPVWPDRKD